MSPFDKNATLNLAPQKATAGCGEVAGAAAPAPAQATLQVRSFDGCVPAAKRSRMIATTQRQPKVWDSKSPARVPVDRLQEDPDMPLSVRSQ